MSYQYTVTERRRRTTNTGGYGASSNRTTFGYWVPLVLTVGAAAVGVAAWIWSERGEDEDESEAEHYPGGVPPPGYASMSGGVAPPPGGMPVPGPPVAGGFQDGGGFPQQGGFQGGPGMYPGPPGGVGGVAREQWESTDMYSASRSTNVQQTTTTNYEQDSGLVARMSSALGINRTASPAGQSFGWAGQQVAAGFAAAGAMVGGALTSLRDGDQGEYRDHERWSEEADAQQEEVKQGILRRGTADEYFSGQVEIPKQVREYRKKRKTVAIVVSAVGEVGMDADLGHHAVSLPVHDSISHWLTRPQSILAHLPEHLNPETTRVFVLIYAPDLKVHPLSTVQPSPSTSGPKPSRSSQSMASSFSNISQTDAQHTPAQTPGDFPTSADGDDQGILANVDPNPVVEQTTSLFKTLYNQAEAIVERETMILPFSSPQGHRNILKSLSPEVVYVQESLCGRDGETVADVSGWVRQIVVVIGDEGGAGGLVDTDDEVARRKGRDGMGTQEGGGQLWWMREERTGLGKRVAVVEGVKVGDDWRRRINEVD